MLEYRLLVNMFHENKNVDHAEKMSAYMKNKFPFLGIKTPERKELMKHFYQETNILKEIELPEQLLRNVWELPEREFQYTVLSMIARRPKWLTQRDVSFIEELIITKSWWDTVDTLAGTIVGELFAREPELINDYIPNWKQHDNIWLRRTALLFQLKYKNKTDKELLFHIIQLNADHTDFFIRKGIGWALREYSKTAPDEVENFINEERNNLSPLSIREGLKHIERDRARNAKGI